MRKEFVKIENYLNATKGIYVNLKKGLSILLFAVATEVIAAPNYNYTLGDCNSSSQVSLPKTNVDIQLENNFETNQSDNQLYGSLMMHRGDLLTPNEMPNFWSVAKQVSEIEFKDSMVCYDERDRQITYDLLTPNDTIVHLTQYYEEPTDQVVFSIERDNRFLYAGHLPFNNFSTQLLKIINKVEFNL